MDLVVQATETIWKAHFRKDMRKNDNMEVKGYLGTEFPCKQVLLHPNSSRDGGRNLESYLQQLSKRSMNEIAQPDGAEFKSQYWRNGIQYSYSNAIQK